LQQLVAQRKPDVSGEKVTSAFRVEHYPKEVALLIRREARTYGLFLPFYTSIRKMEGIFSSRTSVDFYRTAPHYIPYCRTADLFRASAVRACWRW
jgi:hypothetical protein